MRDLGETVLVVEMDGRGWGNPNGGVHVRFCVDMCVGMCVHVCGLNNNIQNSFEWTKWQRMV